MALCPKRAERGVAWPARGCPLQGTARKERPMRPHRTYSLTQPDTHLYINDYMNDSDRPTPLPIHRETRVPDGYLGTCAWPRPGNSGDARHLVVSLRHRLLPGSQHLSRTPRNRRCLPMSWRVGAYLQSSSMIS